MHRDIKPENIMITRSGRVVIMDFGIAKGVTEDGAGTVSGTPAYMAPEQMRGDAMDSRADIFAAGIVLAEMTSRGIQDRGVREIIWRGVRKDPPRLPEGPWKNLLERSVASDPARRHASAVDLVKFACAFDDPHRCRVLGVGSIDTMFARPKGRAGHEENGTPKATYYGCGWSVRPVGGG